MIKEAELDQESDNEVEIHFNSEENHSFKFESPSPVNSSTQKADLNGPSSQFKITGNIQKDIINLMSLKPEYFQFSFTGLKRYLGIHQQQLTNTIDRLLEDSILHKTQDGYFLSPEYRKEGPIINENWEQSELWSGKKLYPTPIPIQKIFRELYGKWFGKNRFLGGGINKEGNLVLDWVDMDNSASKTRLKITSFDVDVKFKLVSKYERDKALNVFNEVFISFNNPIMFELSESLINN